MPPQRLALTMGDPAGVGPEIVLKSVMALSKRVGEAKILPTVVGSVASLEAAAKNISGGYAFIDRMKNGEVADLVDVSGGIDVARIRTGKVSAEAGHVAYRAVERATALAMDGDVDAIVTAPLSKEAMNLAGYKFSGHTELLATLTGGCDPVMMLAHGDLRVAHVTTHIPLAEVPSRMTAQRIRHVIEVTHDALRRMGVQQPRIAVAALNPHAGEGGILGREDLDVTTPLVGELRANGLQIDGPIPGDTVFVKLKAKQYHAVVAMYHDQGHIPVKLLGFDIDIDTGRWIELLGVNMTLGLPIVRTSVDHGTAFDIAGKGIAGASSMLEAINYAVRACGKHYRC